MESDHDDTKNNKIGEDEKTKMITEKLVKTEKSTMKMITTGTSGINLIAKMMK